MATLLIRGAIDPERARFDCLTKPDAFTVRAQVLDLVGDRAAVNIFELFDHLGERRAFNEHAQWDGWHGSQCALVELEERRVECGVARRLRAERVKVRSEVSVRAERLDERHARAHVGQQFFGRDTFRQWADRLGPIDARPPRSRHVGRDALVRYVGLFGRCRHVFDTALRLGLRPHRDVLAG